MATPLILIVEDEWLLASEMARRLTREGFEVLGPVPSVADAMARLSHAVPDAVILDVQLDGETTFALADRLDGMDVPFFFLSGHPVGDFPEQLAGRIVLPKPADWKQVLGELERLTRNPEKTERARGQAIR